MTRKKSNHLIQWLTKNNCSYILLRTITKSYWGYTKHKMITNSCYSYRKVRMTLKRMSISKIKRVLIKKTMIWKRIPNFTKSHHSYKKPKTITKSYNYSCTKNKKTQAKCFSWSQKTSWIPKLSAQKAHKLRMMILTSRMKQKWEHQSWKCWRRQCKGKWQW